MPRLGPFSFWQELCGLPTRASRTVWISAGPSVRAATLAPLLAALHRAHPRVNFALVPNEPNQSDGLISAFPEEMHIAAPRKFGPVLNRYFIDFDVRLLILLEPTGSAVPSLVVAARKRAVPIVLARRVDGPAWHGMPADFEFSLETHDIDTVIAGLAPLLALDLKLLRSERRSMQKKFENWLQKLLYSNVFKNKVRHFNSLEQLREELGAPQSILCLGNGPSSEDPRLSELTCDRLFRVNHSWLERGFLTAADMVFCGSSASVAKVRGAIFAFQSRDSERRLAPHLLRAAVKHRLRFTTLENYPLFLSEAPWRGIRPTNGAAMIATASALQPPRLVISGVDLFSHPEGSYPGDKATPNAYTPGHEADSELALLLEALDRYLGELIILSPALEAAWRAHLENRQ